MKKILFLFAGFIALFSGASLRYADEQIAFLNNRLLLANSSTVSASERSNSLTPQTKEYTLLFAGDIMLSRSVAREMRERNDWRYPFLNIADTLREADFAFGNLEGPISARGKNQGSKYSFRADPRVIEGLTFAGFDALSIANNHIWDWGVNALTDTIDLLRSHNIRPVGAGTNYEDANAARVVEVGDLTLALFAHTNLYPRTLWAYDTVGVSAFELAKIYDRIRAVREKADIVIVSLHWGEEYASHPTEAQRAIARALVDAGADIIVGHHPHVVQDIEHYVSNMKSSDLSAEVLTKAEASAKEGYIFYSLGNFVFDQYFSEATMRGLMAKVIVKDKNIERVEQVLVQINDTFQVELIVP